MGPRFGLIGTRRSERPKKNHQKGFEHGSLHWLTMLGSTCNFSVIQFSNVFEKLNVMQNPSIGAAKGLAT